MYTFKKEERLCNKKLIDGLYHNGSSFLCYPFKVSWQFVDANDTNSPAKIVFSVPKKRFKRAVDRNIVKRQMREAYRLNKLKLLYNILEQNDLRIILSLGYVAKEIITADFAEKKMQKLLLQLSSEIVK